jgi:hypothetical protein
MPAVLAPEAPWYGGGFLDLPSMNKKSLAFSRGFIYCNGAEVTAVSGVMTARMIVRRLRPIAERFGNHQRGLAELPEPRVLQAVCRGR